MSSKSPNSVCSRVSVLRGHCAVMAAVLLLGLASAARGELSGEQIYSLFNQANESFRSANESLGDMDKAEKLYGKAVLSCEKIINEGRIRNAKLYYNLANAYFLKGEIGKAILNYRRAEKLDRADANIQKNLAFARSKRMDKVEVKTEKKVLQTLFFWHYDFSVKTKFAVSLVCFAVVCLASVSMTWFGRRAYLTVTAVVCGMVLLCLSGSVAVDVYKQNETICGVITAAETVARQGDGQNYEASFKGPLHEGIEFDLLERRSGWLHIRLSDGSDGWVPENAGEVI